MRYSNAAWTENLPQSSSNTFFSEDLILSTKQKYSTLDSSSSVDPGATNTQDLSSDECLSDFFHKKSCYNLVTPLATPNLLSVTPSATPTLPPTTPFIAAPSTPFNTTKTPTSTPSNISSSASTTSSLTPPPPFNPNKSVTQSQSWLHQILLNVPSTFLAQNSPVTTTSLPTKANILFFPALANSPEPYELLLYTNAV